MSPPLSVVSDQPAATALTAPNLAERILRLQAEARGLAREHVADLMSALVAAERLSAEVAAGGEAYPVGVREIARRLAEELGGKLQTLSTLAGRST
jgi:hypothetical protein